MNVIDAIGTTILSMMTLSITTLAIMTSSNNKYNVTLSITTFSALTRCTAMICQNTECLHAEYHVLLIMIMLSVVMVNVGMLSVVAP
jgi:hypothetical protein